VQARRKQFISVTGTDEGSAQRRVAAIRPREAPCHSGLGCVRPQIVSAPDPIC